MRKGEERASEVTLVIWLQDLGKELGRRPSLQSTYVSCNIPYLINRIHIDFSLYSTIHISLCIHW
jgi:hypothetical protein